jgi:hypothetical protein
MLGRVISATSWRVPCALGAGAGVGVLAAAALLLWTHYGNAVFFEMILAGLASCF